MPRFKRSSFVSARVARLEALWSVFRPTSELSRLAAHAGDPCMVVAPATADIFRHAHKLHALTHGALDITSGSLVRLWRVAAERGYTPTSEELTAARALVNIADLEVTETDRARLRRMGQQLDLGAIGKGYAAERCIELYIQQGARHAMIDLGGNVAVLGSKPDGSAWRVGIQAPTGRRGEHLGYLEVRDCSVVTSGSYERVYEVAASVINTSARMNTAKDWNEQVAHAMLDRRAGHVDVVSGATLYTKAFGRALGRALSMPALPILQARATAKPAQPTSEH